MRRRYGLKEMRKRNNDNRIRNEENNKLGSEDIAQTILSIVEMRDKGFVPEVTVWATNPF